MSQFAHVGCLIAGLIVTIAAPYPVHALSARQIGLGAITQEDKPSQGTELQQVPSQQHRAQFTNLPLSFEQFGRSEYVARGNGYAVDIQGERAAIVVSASPKTHIRERIGFEFVHARHSDGTPQKELPGKVSYIIGSNPKLWRIGLPTYEQVSYASLYPGIDLIYYGNQKQLEFDLALKPRADVKSIRMRFSGTGALHTDDAGNLVLGAMRLAVPKVTQGARTVAAHYKLVGHDEVAFEVASYDRDKPLTIDPTLVYSTQLGGGNNYNQGNAIALDASGNIYVAGYTASDDFPAVNPAFAAYSANTDGFISKLNPAGNALIYSTYIGGSGYDSFQAIAVDSTGAAWVAGTTTSSDFPLLTPYQSAQAGGNDAVIVKLSPDGALAYSTLLGGPGYDGANSVAVDPFDNAYITGQTDFGFPTTNGAYEATSPGGVDAFVTKFTSTGTLVWSTLVGGNRFDYANGIAVDRFGNTYIAGMSYSASFPGAPTGGAQPVNKGNGDAFVAKLNFNGSALLYFTFLGGSGNDRANAISVESTSGIAVIAGQTQSSNLPVSAGAAQTAIAGGSNGFIAKLNAAGSAFLYTTYLGGNHTDAIRGLAIDSAGSAYVTGSTDSSTFPLSSALQPSMVGNTATLSHSTDTGATWTPFDINIPGMVLDISPDPLTAGTIVVSTENGIYRTVNEGASWTLQNEAGYLSLARSPANPAVIYGYNCGTYQSADDGKTWTYKGNSSPNCGNRIVADPLSANTAYDYGDFGVRKTTDGGVTWNLATNGIPANQSVGKMVATSNGNLYVALRSAISGQDALGVYKSSDQGGSWTAANTGLPSNFPLGDLAAGPSNAVFITDFFTLYETTNGGASWNVNGALPVKVVGCIANFLGISAVNPSIVYWAPCNFGWGMAPVATSTNAGASWTFASGLGPASVHAIVTDPLNSAGVYVIPNFDTSPFVAAIDSTGRTLLYSSYLGDLGTGQAIAANATGDVFVTGATRSSAFPTTLSALQGNSYNTGSQTEAFVTRISTATSSCSYHVSPEQYLAGPFEFSIEFSVVAPSGCTWTASSDQGWARILTEASGSGTGVVYVQLDVNDTGATRAATLNLAGRAVTMNQLPTSCNPGFSTPWGSTTVPNSGGRLQLNVTAGSACDWNVSNADPYAISVVSGATGKGNGTVTLNVAPNLGPNTRTLHFYIQQGNGVYETISQAGTTAPAVVSTITSSPSGASIAVTGAGCIPGTYTTPASLTWNANTNCTIRFVSPQPIGGSTYNFYSATFNGGPVSTANPLTVNSGTTPPIVNATFVAPCQYSFSPSSQSMTASGGLGSFAVTTATTCTWTAVANASWITILPSGSKGPGKVSYSVAANTGAARNGTISVGGQAFNISQQAPGCTYSIGPSSAAFDNSGGTARVVVTTSSGCAWTASSNATWMTVTSGASGTGSGAVVISAAANPGTVRSSTVTIAGQTFSATQGAGACGAIDVTSQVMVTDTSHNKWTPPSTYSGSIVVKNKSASLIHGPVYVVLIGEPTHFGFPRDSLLFGSQLLTTCFTALGDYLLPVSGDLQPGQTAGYATAWSTQTSGRIAYSIKVLSGTPVK